MAKKILFAKAKVDEEERNIYCNDLDKEDYDSKYKGHLTCINGCKARVKFTQKKNNIKFFSTWNKEGKLHNKDCPYFVEYKGVKGRQKLNAYYKSIELDDDTIFNRIKRKYNELHRSYNGNEYPVPDRGSMEIENTGEEIVDTSINTTTGEESSVGSYIRHKDANFVTTDDLGSMISVYGVIDNVWLDQNKDGTKFAYINYVTKNTSVNILFSEAFRITQLLTLIFRKALKEPVPNFIPLQLDEMTQFDTVTCSTSKPGASVLKHIPSSSQSIIQSDITTLRLLISIPSQL